MRFYCVQRSHDGRVNVWHNVEADNAIEALREAATKAGVGGRWTAYREVVAKDVAIERTETRRVVFS